MRLLILLLTASMVLASSCTIQKRSFRNGYYISWNKSVPKDKAESNENISETKTEQPAKELLVVKDSLPKEEECMSSKNEELVDRMSPKASAMARTADRLQPIADVPVGDSSVEESADRYSEETLLKRLGEAVESMKPAKNVEIEEDTGRKRLNLFSLNALVFSIAYVILLFSALNMSGKSVTIAITAIFICAILAIIFAIIGLVKWGRDRYGFWGTFFSIIALGLLVVGMLAFLLYVIANLSFS